MSQEGSSAWWIYPDVQKRRVPVRLQIELGVPELLLPGEDVLHRHPALEPRARRRPGQLEMPFDPALCGNVGLSRQLRHPADDETGDVDRHGDRAIQDRLARLPIAATSQKLRHLRSGDGERGVRPRDRLAVRLRSQTELRLLVDGELRLERETVDLSGDDRLAPRRRDDLGRKGRSGDANVEADLAGAALREHPGLREPV